MDDNRLRVLAEFLWTILVLLVGIVTGAVIYSPFYDQVDVEAACYQVADDEVCEQILSNLEEK